MDHCAECVAFDCRLCRTVAESLSKENVTLHREIAASEARTGEVSKECERLQKVGSAERVVPCRDWLEGWMGGVGCEQHIDDPILQELVESENRRVQSVCPKEADDAFQNERAHSILVWLLNSFSF